MEEGAHFGHLSYRPVLGVGISAPTPLVSEFCLERYSSVLSSVTRLQGFKIPSLVSRGHSSICAPSFPHLFFQQYMKKKIGCFLRALLASSGGGGGHLPLSPPPPPPPPPLGPALTVFNSLVYLKEQKLNRYRLQLKTFNKLFC